MIILITIIAAPYVFLYLKSNFTHGRIINHEKAHSLCVIGPFRKILNRTILYFRMIMEFMFDYCLRYIAQFFVSSNHLIISLDIIAYFTLALLLTKLRETLKGLYTFINCGNVQAAYL